MNVIKDRIGWKPLWTITKFADDAAFERGEHFEKIEIPGNLLLNEGITALLNLLTGAAETAFNNANSYLGVGDSSSAAAADQTGLQAATNKLYKAMEATYPQITDQSVAFRSVFTSDEANFAWNEMTVANGNSDASENLNRKVSSQGTKASGQTWQLRGFTG
jgi:hypothetical protein